MTEEETDPVQQVTACIQEALRKNRRTETVLVVMLTVVFFAGLGFLATGLMTRRWEMAVPGGLCELALAWPIKSLIRLRKENIMLEVLPSAMRMADDSTKKKLVFEFVKKLIEQV